MHKLINTMLLLLVLFPVYATEPSEEEIQSQQYDQEACVQKILNPCIEKCKHQDDIDCRQACQENAKNECRQAGE
ncbi:Uncharacterised protein [Legionella lansingensis]|uniref:Uncharacterized protein n=1 Tax=Legionella lansingensis TaxID=45067 RepID=A0A0W0VQD0_9GAMM|nr:hypothetical protein [Legionella lansingensis]KTD21958.1 hypothetical protein Llan_1532 [Legionella lansingensis]SNV46121.1 Uncharacterised protein [Legionella lansingensis]